MRAHRYRKTELLRTINDEAGFKPEIDESGAVKNCGEENAFGGLNELS
jgi:hypothetical protein